MMRILVTGSQGVIGSALVKELESRGHHVFGIDLFHAPGERGFIQHMSDEEYTYCRCDIAEYRQIERIFKFGCFDMVYNCAAEFGRWNGEDYYEQLWRTNMIGLKHIIRIQEKQRFKLIQFSSSEVYGDFEGVMREEIMNEEEIPQLNDYAITKWAGEMQIKNSALLHDTETVIVRLFNTYGPGETYHPYRSVNCKFCYHALKGLPVTVYRDHYRSSSYISDCVKTLANISGNFHSGRVYNIGSNEFHDIETLARLSWQAAGADTSLIRYEHSEKLTTRIKRIDNTKAVNELGHKETVTLAEGVKNTVKWMKEYYHL